MTQPDLPSVAALIGEPARARMLDALTGGRRIAAGELAALAGVSPPTASEHLARLLAGGLVVAERHGRHRWFALARPEVAAALDSLRVLTAPQEEAPAAVAATRAQRLQAARTCYDHLAGRLGIALADGLVAGGWLIPATGGWTVTEIGERRFATLGVDVAALRGRRRALARGCLDWTERRHHVAGAVGSGLAHELERLGWTRRVAGTRAVEVTPDGRAGLRQALGVTV